MKPQLLRPLLQLAAFIYEQHAQPIIVSMAIQCYSQRGGLGSPRNWGQAITHCLPPHHHLRAKIYPAHWNWHIFYCCYHKETWQSASPGLLLFGTFPICILPSQSFKETLKILQRLSITSSPRTSNSIVTSYDLLSDKKCRLKNCQDQLVPKQRNLIKLSSK